MFAIHVSAKFIEVSLSSSLDLASTSAFKNEFEQVMSSDITSVRVNAGGLDYIDSSGVASLLFMRKLCSRFGSSLEFESISDAAARVIQLANLESVFGLPKAVSSLVQSSATPNIDARLFEPKFSDVDAMAIFQNDLPAESQVTSPKVAEVGTFEIKPPSFM